MPAADPRTSTVARVLAALREAGERGVSGERLAGELSLSRAAVWKAIASLRDDGCRIDAVSGHGYRLVSVADRLRSELVTPWLTTSRLGRLVRCYDTVESTMDAAAERARAGDPEGLVIVAESQTAGRGRRGRTWHSPTGLNLYFSVLLRPRVAPHELGPVTLVVGVALARAVHELAGLRPLIKWPNDLYFGASKVAGILTELSAEMDRVHHVVVGVGLNVNGSPSDFSAELEGRATSLAIECGGTPLDRARLLATFLNHLEPAYDRFLAAGLEPFLAEIEAASAVRGCRVTVDLGRRRVEGVAGSVAPDGALAIDLADGSRIDLHSGEIISFAAERVPPC